MPVKINLKTKIRFNGQEYSSVEAMPPDARQAYERAIAAARDSLNPVQVKVSTKIVFNGHEYSSLDEMPPEIHRQYEQVMALVDANRSGSSLTPDVLGTVQSITNPPVRDNIIPAAPIFPTGNSAPPRDRRWLIAGVALIILLVTLTGLAMFVLRLVAFH